MQDSGVKKVWLSWSSGKDSAWALHVLRAREDVEVVGLLTTVNAEHDRVAMHGVRRELLEAQARAAGLPLIAIDLPWPCDNAAYAERMTAACERARAEGACGIAFGDLYLEDIRKHREEQLAGTGLTPLFPLWGRDTRELIEEMLGAGLRAVLTCVDSRQLDASFSGRALDQQLLAELPDTVDPCGEGGEFHTFVTAAPVFDAPIAVERGETVDREGFVFTDLLPG